MNPIRLLLLALLPLSACGDVNHSAADYTPSNSRLATAGNDEVPRRAPVVFRALPSASAPPAAAPHSSASVALAPRASSLRGSGRLESAGPSTLVRVDLAGGTPHTTYEGAVRQGSCAAIGSTVTPLVPVTVDSAGVGRSDSAVAVPIALLQGTPHAVVYGPGGRTEACGAIPAASAPPA